MSVFNVSTASSNQPITPPQNTPVCGSAAAAAIAATVLAPSAADASSPSLAAGRASLVSTEAPTSKLSPFDLLPDEMILKILLEFSAIDIVRMRVVDTRFRAIGNEALKIKISKEYNIPIAKLWLQGNTNEYSLAEDLIFLDAIESKNRSIFRILTIRP